MTVLPKLIRKSDHYTKYIKTRIAKKVKTTYQGFTKQIFRIGQIYSEEFLDKTWVGSFSLF